MLFKGRSPGSLSGLRRNAITRRERGRRGIRPDIEALEVRALLSSITDLGTLPGFNSSSEAHGINDSGQVVGLSENTSYVYHAFLYSGGSMTDLGTLGGQYSSASGINKSGQIVGGSYTTAPGVSAHAFLYSGGSMTDLGTFGGPESAAEAINDSGQVAGFAEYQVPIPGTKFFDYYYHAFFYGNGGMSDLGTLGGKESFAYGINNSGQVVGDSDTQTSIHAFLYSDGSMTDLGVLPGYSGSYAYGINDSGQVAGVLETSGITRHAFLYSGGSMIDLGTLPGYKNSAAAAINNSGQVVGEADSGSSSQVAFLYRPGSGMLDLNSLLPPNSGWHLTLAWAINNNGQIVGEGLNPDGQVHAFLLSLSSVDIAVKSVSTPDAKSVNLDYSVSGSDLSQPFDVAVYRSDNPDPKSFNINTAIPVGSPVVIPATDSSGASSTTQGSHKVTVNLAGEVTIDSTHSHPYLFVVANPPGSGHVAESDDSNDTNDVAALGTITAAQLTSILGPVAAQYVGPLNEAMGEFSIITPKRQAAFLGQIAVESAMPYGPQAGVPLSTLAEQAPKGVDPVTYFDIHYSGYGGNIPGTDDGYNFRGQGPLMMTGRTAYTAAQAYFNFSTSIVSNPSQVSTNPEIGFLTSAWFWSVYSTALTKTLYGVDGLNHLADSLTFTGPPVTPNQSFLIATANLNFELTRIITGPGVPQLMRRWAYYVSALTQLLPQG